MNIERLWEILGVVTLQLRKGDVVEKDGATVHVYSMPHESEAKPTIEKVDCHFVTIGVDKDAAEKHREEFIDLLDKYPQPERLAGGPSYIELGGVIGDQGMAFQFFALGQVLKLWEVITPKTLGVTGQAADALAGRGMVMISGYKG